jgi:EAL domain-containing protein (putative c-di-GMP-specific phosphodiesterase class I)
MQPGGLALRNLEALRRAGVRISIDDFGTGYSALSYLAKLPLDAVKLDRAFVAPIAGDQFQAELAESVITLAHRQGLSVVGEGVETAAQLGRLQAMGCDEAQGFLFARPLEADDFAEFMRRELVVAASAPRLVLSA